MLVYFHPLIETLDLEIQSCRQFSWIISLMILYSLIVLFSISVTCTIPVFGFMELVLWFFLPLLYYFSSLYIFVLISRLLTQVYFPILILIFSFLLTYYWYLISNFFSVCSISVFCNYYFMDTFASLIFLKLKILYIFLSFLSHE